MTSTCGKFYILDSFHHYFLFHINNCCFLSKWEGREAKREGNRAGKKQENMEMTSAPSLTVKKQIK